MPATTAPSRGTVGPDDAGRQAARPPWGRVLGTSSLAGALVALSVPPWGVWPLGVAGLGLLVWRLEGLAVRARAMAGFAAGLTWYLATLAWMTQFNLGGGALAAVGEAAFIALACAATPARRGSRLRGVLAFPAALVLAEGVIARWPFGGEPLGDVALGQAAGPLAQAARLGGPLLVIGLAALSAGALAQLTRRRPSGLVPAALVVAATLAALAAPDGGRAVGAVSVAAVQGGGRRGLHRLENDQGIVFDAQVAATTSVTGPVDLVVWPENVIDLDGPLVGAPEAGVVAGLARRLGATVVAGVTEPAGDTRFRNAVVAWAPDGGMVGRYEKVRRVPFGEYVPLRPLIRHLVHLELVPRDALPGRGPNVLLTPAGRLGVLISYEVFFSDRDRAALRHGAQVLLVPTNAASFTTTQMPTQEVAAARLRAIEAGRDVVQAAPTGYSVLVDHRGRATGRSTLGRRQVVYGSVRLRTGRTLYRRAGDVPVLGLAALVLLVAGVPALAGGALRRPCR
ncbi:MAG TPA: apolipoprotein N-acyltransferase [Acidimicrobiales bacterium]|nr:apolipoprotein N-acyltransferase [Acidimicrobiales bacterium]